MNYQILDDDELTRGLQTGDAKAYQVIYDRYWLKLYALAYAQVGTKEEAKDVVHNLFESLWKNRQTSNIRDLSTYLTISIRYRCISHIKSQINLRKYHEYLIFQEIHQSSAAEDIINLSDLQKAIEEALKKLPEKTVEVFKMSRFEHKTTREIADSMNLSEKAVEYHITKSLKILKEHLEYHNN